MKKIALIILSVFCITSCFAQDARYKFAQINLEVKNFDNSHIRFSLYHSKSTYCITIKHNQKIDSNDWASWIKQDYDTLYLIDIETFEEIVEKVINLPYPKILNEMIFYDPITKDNGAIVELEYVIGYGNGIIYTIKCPYCSTKERNLEQFLEVCQSIILLAKMNPKEIL
jgi:hypothetical protein